MHTYLCKHAEGEPANYAAHALQAGLTEIGCSDHAPMPRDDFDNWRMEASQLPTYIKMIERARADYPQLQIKAGLEVDYIPGYEDWIRHLGGFYEWDYFIGSVHYLTPAWDIDNPQKISEW